MRHADLPEWLKPALPASRHGHLIEYRAGEVQEMLSTRRTLSKLNDETFRLTAAIPGRCWACGNPYQNGTLVQDGWEAFTTRHVRRGWCSYRAYSESEAGSWSFNPAVQVNELMIVRLKLGVERVTT